MSNEKMSAADVLEAMDSAYRFLPAREEARLMGARIAVAGLIEREAALIAERDAQSKRITLLEGQAYAHEQAAEKFKLQARAAEAERDALAELHAAVLENGEWDDGCFYYAGRSASELQHALAGVDKARAKTRKPATGAEK